MPPASFDAEHNILAAMVKWVEEGHAPDTLTATFWKDNSFVNGVEFTRPLCKVGDLVAFHASPEPSNLYVPQVPKNVRLQGREPQ